MKIKKFIIDKYNGLFLFLILPGTAVNLGGPLNSIGDGLYGENAPVQSLPALIGVYIKSFLYLLGVMLVIIIVYAGYLWMTAGGTEDQVVKAKKWLSNGITGLIITLAAFAITNYILSNLVKAAG